MSKILLYIDEDSMDEDFVQALRTRNVDALTVADVGMLHKADEEQLDWAIANGRVIFSFNTRDFHKRKRTEFCHQSPLSEGLVQIKQQVVKCDHNHISLLVASTIFEEIRFIDLSCKPPSLLV